MRAPFLSCPLPSCSTFTCLFGSSLRCADFSPLREDRQHTEDLATVLPDHVALLEVDAHNIVPAWILSDAVEPLVRTWRPKIHDYIEQFLTDFPPLVPVEGAALDDSAALEHVRAAPLLPDSGMTDWAGTAATLRIDWSVPEVSWLRPGERAAEEVLAQFLAEKCDRYADRCADAMRPAALSNLSPFLRFGHIAPQRIVLEMVRVLDEGLPTLFVRAPSTGPQTFADLIVVHRELAENFCLYERDYDSPNGFPEWSRISLEEHSRDIRPFAYTLEELERARTHDALWNAAHMELVHRGKMHPTTRRYWAKQLLQWTRSPAEALAVALELNNRFSLDGGGPLAFAGCAWAVGGVHDSAHTARQVYGKVASMSREDCEALFNVRAYIAKHKVVPLAPFSKEPPAHANAKPGGGGEEEDGGGGVRDEAMAPEAGHREGEERGGEGGGEVDVEMKVPAAAGGGVEGDVESSRDGPGQERMDDEG